MRVMQMFSVIQLTMEYKKPLPDEGDPNPAPEFTTAESGPVGRQTEIQMVVTLK